MWFVIAKEQDLRESMKVTSQVPGSTPVEIQSENGDPTGFFIVGISNKYQDEYANFIKFSEAEVKQARDLISNGITVPTQQLIPAQTAAFAAKELPNGKKLFKRVWGFGDNSEVEPGSTKNFTFIIPYPHCKITDTSIIGGQHGDSVDFLILDTEEGAVSGYPNHQLNQFGFNVWVTPGVYKEASQYDADLYLGMQIQVVYRNGGPEIVRPLFNLTLHEVI